MQTLRRSSSNFSIRSKFSSHGQSHNWHRQVSLEAGDRHPIGVGHAPDTTFPWAALRQLTDSYLTKKKGRNTGEDLDARLVLLIKNHAAKDVAIAACGHAMSPKAVRGLLAGELNIELGDAYGLPSYLQAIIAANHVNEGAVSALEAQRAMELIASSNTSAGRYLEALLQILINGVPSHFLIYPHIQTLARLACVEFESQLEALRRECQWQRAQAATEWLSKFVLRSVESSPENLDSMRLLDANFAHWRAWAAWGPDVARILRWELFSTDQRLTLRNLLALQGPDYINNRYATLREAVEAQGFNPSLIKLSMGSLTFEVRRGLAHVVPNMVHRLLNLVDAAVVSSPDDTAILAYFCVGRSITSKALDCLESLSSIADGLISSLVSQVYQARNETRALQMAAVMRLLPVLGTERCNSLRAAIGSDVTSLVRRTLDEMQKLLLSRIQSGQSSTDTETKLHACGSGLLEVSWLWPSLDNALLELFNDWPTVEDVGHLHSIRNLAKRAATRDISQVLKKVDGYFVDCLVRRGTINTGTKILVKALITLWDRAPDSDRRLLALSVVQGQVISTDFRCRCLAQLPGLPDGFIHSLRVIIENYDQAPAVSCVDLTSLLAATALPATCWRPVLSRMIEGQGQKLIDYALANLKAEEFVQFLSDLRSLYGEDMQWDPATSPAILNPKLHRWTKTLDMYLPVISQLESESQCRSTVQCILSGGDDPQGILEEALERILVLLTFNIENHSRPLMIAIMSLLKRDGGNAMEVQNAVSLLGPTTEDGCDACLHVLDLFQNKSGEVAEIVLAGWLLAPSLTVADNLALQAMAEVLGMHPGSEKDWSGPSLKVVTDYLDEQYAAILAEAQRLESMRAALKSVDSSGTSQLLASVGIEDHSPVDDALSSLPAELIGVVEKVDDQRVEMLFPLTHLTQLQRIGFGIGKAQSLFLHFRVGDDGIPPGFCLHWDTDMKGKHKQGHDAVHHYPWMVFPGGDEPHLPICQGQISPAKYHLARTLSRHLIEGFKSLEAVHVLVTGTLENLGRTCITCGWDHGVRLRCPAICQIPLCSKTFLQASLEVHLSQIRQDPSAVDALVSMVHWAASSGRLELLPNCPFDNTATILQILNSLPAMSYLQKRDGLAAAIKASNPQAEKLLLWVCTAYRGFLSSAKGSVRIPSLPQGTHQFLLANSAPEHEAAFAGHLTNTPLTRVLFHGTSLDRLFAITCQGLRVLSNTPLQAHGAAAGAGVYCAEEPSMSWGYSSLSGPTQNNWAQSEFRNFRVLLGVENAGPSVGNGGMHVVRDPTTLCVRYMFWIPAGVATVPVAAHITPAMLSVYTSLRSGAL